MDSETILVLLLHRKKTLHIAYGVSTLKAHGLNQEDNHSINFLFLIMEFCVHGLVFSLLTLSPQPCSPKASTFSPTPHLWA